MNRFRLLTAVVAFAFSTGAWANPALVDESPVAKEAGAATPTLRMPALFADGMVLQCDQAIPVWGWALPEQRVLVRFGEQSTEAITGADGRWIATLPAQPASATPRTLTIEAHRQIDIRDVLVGEVWVCGGQSNMEWPVGPRSPGGEGIRDWKREIENANFPQIRLFDVKNAASSKPRADCEGVWRACSPETVGAFSAVGYFFGREIHAEVKRPIGLISSNWGGTPAESWTSVATIRKFPEFGESLADVEKYGDDVAAADAAHRADMDAWLTKLDAAESGISGGWAQVAFEDREWRAVAAPGPWRLEELKAFDGVIWARRRVELPTDWAGAPAELTLGPIDDMDRTFVNGVQVGATERRGQAWEGRRYRVPEGVLRPGANLIAIRVTDIGGGVGFNANPGEMQIANRGNASAVATVSLEGEWRTRMSVELDAVGPPPRERGLSPHQPTSLYNGMIAPLVPFGIRGVIWYQGESNRARPAQYCTLFPAMIEDWRINWGQGDIPFYYVQIAPYAYENDSGGAALLREAQMLTLQRVPNVGMAVTMDIGDPRDIHPANKQDVGKRLALWALAKTYGRSDVVFSGPIYRAMRVHGDAIRLSFDFAEGGIASRGGGALTHFSIAGADRKFVPASAEIAGNEVIVRASSVANPVAVRYAWGAADEPNLMNAAGLPASSFRTDVWE